MQRAWNVSMTKEHTVDPHVVSDGCLTWEKESHFQFQSQIQVETHAV